MCLGIGGWGDFVKGVWQQLIWVVLQFDLDWLVDFVVVDVVFWQCDQYFMVIVSCQGEYSLFCVDDLFCFGLVVGDYVIGWCVELCVVGLIV